MFLNPAKVVEKMNLMPGMKVADFGCGSGHLTVEMAKKIGGNGVIYAFDVQAEALEAVKSRAETEHLSNVEIARVDLEKENATGLADGIADMVLISNMLFQVGEKENVVKEAYRILRPEGRAVVIEWSFDGARDNKLGPISESRVKKELVEEIFSRVGFRREREIEVSGFHYGIIFKKS